MCCVVIVIIKKISMGGKLMKLRREIAAVDPTLELLILRVKYKPHASQTIAFLICDAPAK